MNQCVYILVSDSGHIFSEYVTDKRDMYDLVTSVLTKHGKVVIKSIKFEELDEYGSGQTKVTVESAEEGKVYTFVYYIKVLMSL